MKLIGILCLLAFWRLALASPRIFNIGFGQAELADIVEVDVNGAFTLRVRLNSAKGSVPVSKAKNARGFYASDQAGYLVENAQIISGPAGVRCFFSRNIDSGWWLTNQFTEIQRYNSPYFAFFATHLWCYLPVKDVVRLMIAPEVEMGHMLDVPLAFGSMGGITLGSFPLGYEVDKLYMIDGDGVRCYLVNKDRRLADARSGRVYFTADSPILESQLGRWGSIVCLTMLSEA